MAKVSYSVPIEIKNRFNEVFASENKSYIIAELMKQAIEQRNCQQQRAHAINDLLKLRAKQKPISNRVIKLARTKDRA